MAEWYQDAAWRMLREIRGAHLLARYNVSSRFLDPEPREPYVLLGNHAHRLDPWVVGTLLTRTIRYMANLEGTSPAKAMFADLVGAYGKRKGAPDYSALKRTLLLGRAGETIGIFPEGDRTWDGRPLTIRPGLGKLLRSLSLPILMARQTGSYLTGPRWAKSGRRGRWIVEFRTLSREAVLGQSPETLERAIRDYLCVDDLKNPSLQDVRFDCAAPAAGIERLLWFCPSCGGEDDIAGISSRIRCRACGASWIVDGNQRLDMGPTAGSAVADLSDLRDWTEFQRGELARRTAEATPLGILPADSEPDPRVPTPRVPDKQGLRPIVSSQGVELRRRVERGEETFGRGSLELHRDALLFHPAKGGKPAVFDPARVLYFVDHFNVYSEFSYGRSRYKLFFRGAGAYKWIEALETLRGKRGERI